MIEHRQGDITQLDASQGAHIVAHLCNAEGRWGAGVSGAIGRAWPAAERHYRRWHKEGPLDQYSVRTLGGTMVYERGPFKLGEAQFVEVALGDAVDEALTSPQVRPGGRTRRYFQQLWVANLVAQKFIRRKPTDPDAVDYVALMLCLEQLSWMASVMLRASSQPLKPATIHMPMIGSGLAGGDWARILQMIQARLVDGHALDVIIYEFVRS